MLTSPERPNQKTRIRKTRTRNQKNHNHRLELEPAPKNKKCLFSDRCIITSEYRVHRGVLTVLRRDTEYTKWLHFAYWLLHTATQLHFRVSILWKCKRLRPVSFTWNEAGVHHAEVKKTTIRKVNSKIKPNACDFRKNHNYKMPFATHKSRVHTQPLNRHFFTL